MILAAYLVTGFLVASIYAVGMLRGRRDRIHRLGLLIPLTVASIATPIQFAVGDTAARAIAKDQPVKFAAMECVQQTHSDVTEYIYGRCTAGRRQGRHRHPRLRLVPRRLEHEHAGDRARLGAARRPAARQHDAALGLRHDGRDLHGADRARRLVRVRLVAEDVTSRRRSGSCARSRSPAWPRSSRSSAAGSSPRSAASRGSSTTSCAPPTRSPRPTASGSRSRWCSPSTSLLGATLIITLRAMSRRWRDEDGTTKRCPTARTPSAPPLMRRSTPVTARERRRRHPRRRRDDVRRLRRRRLRRRVLEPARRWRRARPAAARADRLGDRAGLGGEPRVADLRARRLLDRLPVRLRVRLLDAVHPAEPGCVRDRPARSRLRVPAHRAPRARPSPRNDRLRRGVGADPVLPGNGRRRGRGRPRAGRQCDGRHRDAAGSTCSRS